MHKGTQVYPWMDNKTRAINPKLYCRAQELSCNTVITPYGEEPGKGTDKWIWQLKSLFCTPENQQNMKINYTPRYSFFFLIKTKAKEWRSSKLEDSTHCPKLSGLASQQ